MRTEDIARIDVPRSELEDAFFRWEKDRRDQKFDYDDQQPLEDVARDLTDALLGYLFPDTAVPA